MWFVPNFAPYTVRQLDFVLKQIGEAIYTVVGELDIQAWCTREPVLFTERRSGEERALSVGDKWGDLFDCAWFHFTGTVPETAAGKKVVLLIDVNGELCVFDRQGVPVRGLTSVSSTYDYRLGWPGKRVLQFVERARGGERVDIWADGGCNDLFGNLQGNGTIVEASIATCDDEMRALYYDFEVLLDFLKVLPEEGVRYQQILAALNDAAHALLARGSGSVRDARQALAPMLARRGGDPSLRISAIGHAHMDLAWLWPVRETIRKCARTFSTALELMERYPDYVYGASQPQQYQWIKAHYPALYAKIVEKVRQGRIEPQGAMWVEADTNVTGGEALVRQILLGKRFFKEEFGVDVTHLWLPDVFGYSAALPQILAKSGVDYFMTQKLSWNLINTFPHHSFHWQGIDGSSVLAHMLPEETYNSPAAPRSVAKIEQNYKDVGVSGYSLMLFGIGDGGGGPGAEHLERLDRIANLSGLSPVQQEPAADFFARWAQDAGRFPTWVGELYLERHQGTLTTEAGNKWYNRRMELALRELEWTAALASLLAGAPYPADRLDAIWREVLLYQFHDILPGSSIVRVYDESLVRYQAMLAEVSERIAENDRRLAGRIDTAGMAEPVVVYNALSWERTEWVQANGRWVRVTVPPMGYVVIDAATTSGDVPQVTATESLLENDLLRVRFHPDGSIASIYDQEAQREVCANVHGAEGQAANRLAVYADWGDAWDFPMDYAEARAGAEPRGGTEPRPYYMELVAATPRMDGPCAILEQVYRLGHSELVQEIVLTAGGRRLEFRTRARWREVRSMLRTSFPVAVHAESATFEIQFGHIRRPTHRNTTWDLARDEVAAHKWADLSQRDYGVALLNDSKYGHKVKGNVLDLDLLRSVPYPGPRLVRDEDVKPGEPHHGYTDQCDHRFTYALYPHPGDHVAGRVVQAGYELNVPLRVMPAQAHAGAMPLQASFLKVDAPNVIVEAVKKAEEGDDLIVRLYESAHMGTRVRLRFGFPVRVVTESSLIEEDICPLELEEDEVAFEFKPFEIKTLRVGLR
jgi:alpha-mannosidase